MRVDFSNQQTSFKGYKLGKKISLLRRAKTIESLDAFIKKATEAQDPLIESDMDVVFDGHRDGVKTFLQAKIKSRIEKGFLDKFFAQTTESIDEETAGGITLEQVEKLINQGREHLNLPVPSEITHENMKSLRMTVQQANETEERRAKTRQELMDQEKDLIHKFFGPPEDLRSGG